MRIKVAGAIVVLIVSLSCGVREEVEALIPRTSPVGVGETAPDFTLEDQNYQKVTLSSSRGRVPTVLVFYRGHW